MGYFEDEIPDYFGGEDDLFHENCLGFVCFVGCTLMMEFGVLFFFMPLGEDWHSEFYIFAYCFYYFGALS